MGRAGHKKIVLLLHQEYFLHFCWLSGWLFDGGMQEIMRNSREPAAKSRLNDAEVCVSVYLRGMYMLKSEHIPVHLTHIIHTTSIGIPWDSYWSLLLNRGWKSQGLMPQPLFQLLSYRHVLHCCTHDGHGSWFVPCPQSSLWNNRTSERNCLICCFLQQSASLSWKGSAGNRWSLALNGSAQGLLWCSFWMSRSIAQ